MLENINFWSRNVFKWTFVFISASFLAIVILENKNIFSINSSTNVEETPLRQRLLGRYKRETEKCSENLTITSSSGGSISSPGYPDRYPSNIDCRWTLNGPDNSNIVLRIKQLDLEKRKECDLDYLQVHLGPTTLSHSLERMCGTISDKVIVTNSSVVLLAFHSDPSYEDKGFTVDYYLQSSKGCEAILTSSAGTIESPKFPDNYPDDSDCWTLITVAEDKRILFQFDSLELEFDENCTYDFVEIHDGSTRDAISLGRFCSSNHKVSIESTGNVLLVYFHSDHLVNKKGFHAQYTAISSHEGTSITDIGGCLWESDVNNGTIASPNYPQKYPSNAKCKILVKAPEKHVIELVFDILQMEIEANCSYDYLEIVDGSEKEPGNTYRFCGKSSEPRGFNSTTNRLFITFHSDDFAEFSGFKATYRYHSNFNESGETESETELTIIEMEDTFTDKPKNATLPEGASYMLHCAVSDPTAKMRWLKDYQFLGGNNPLPGLKTFPNHTLWFQSFNKQLVGIYTCAAITSENANYAKAWIQLENDPDPNNATCSIVFRKSPRDSSFTEGEFAHMECLAAGNQIETFWEKDGFPIDDKGNHITILRNGFFFIDKISIQDAGIYTCIAVDGISGCQKRVSATFTVNGKAKLMEICGQPKIAQPSETKPHLEHGKIVGGDNTKKGAYPWQVMLWERKIKSFCGASLVNERWIVTAAHCFTTYKNLRWDDIVIKLGKHNREIDEPEEIRTSIADSSSIVIHPAFNRENFDNDIALIRLKDHIKFTDYILPICLSNSTMFNNMYSAPLTMGTVTGWGKLTESGVSPKFLQEIQLPIVQTQSCKQSTKFTVTGNMFCAGFAQEILGDSCQGDSGGPFAVHQNNRWYLTGIVSWGEGCGRANKYGFYTKISNYAPWIRGIMKS